MKNIFLSTIVALLFIAVSIGCSKQTETLNVSTPNEYFPLEIGRTFLYRMDSTVGFNFGEKLVVYSYQAMDSIESKFTDNTGRESYRIYRYIRDTAGRDPWRFAYTFVATKDTQSIEYVDNNLRFIKLHGPIKEGYRWQGNSYINTVTDNIYLAGWEYEYQEVGKPYTINGKTYENTITVLQQDEFSPEGPFDPNLQYQQRNYSVEVYAKGVGLIFKDFLHYAWQKPVYEDGSYGVKLSLISYK